MRGLIPLRVDGHELEVDDDGASLLDVLRDRVGSLTAKDGCSPQGQCGCCTVLVDGAPRVACVTPVRRVAGRDVVTLDGLPEAEREGWVRAFVDVGASQCGFCTPGIIVRLVAEHRAKPGADPRPPLVAHLCRCTGWQTIVEAWAAHGAATRADAAAAPALLARNFDVASRRASIEGWAAQRVSTDVVCGAAGFADDRAPHDALVAMRTSGGEWVVAETVAEARRLAGKVQGRRTTAAVRWPVALPDAPPEGWARTLRTTWVEPAYLEPDASWCEPGAEPASPLANGGAFGGKVTSPVAAIARRLADEHGRAVRVLFSREDVVRHGSKRPPLAAGLTAGGHGVMRVRATPGLPLSIGDFSVEPAEVSGPPTSLTLRAALWAEAAALTSSLHGPPDEVRAPWGAVARAEVTDEVVRVHVACGDPLDAIVLRSYCIGAAHQALGWVRSEGLAVDDAGEPHDLTIRSFGILRARDMPRVDVEIDPRTDSFPEPVNGSDAVFAAVAAAAWRHAGFSPTWPVGSTP